jgi:hypothetical protein
VLLLGFVGMLRAWLCWWSWRGGGLVFFSGEVVMSGWVEGCGEVVGLEGEGGIERDENEAGLGWGDGLFG